MKAATSAFLSQIKSGGFVPAFFRSLLLAALGASTFTNLIGCDHFFNNDRKVNDPLVMKDQSLSCVRTVGTQLSSFLNGAEDKNPAELAECLSLALKKFAADTRGKASESGWTRSELSTFFETYFKTDAAQKKAKSALSDQATALTAGSGTVDELAPLDEGPAALEGRRAVINETFRWKAVLLGGSEQKLTRDELERLQSLLLAAREPLSKLKGYGDLISLRRDLKVRAASVSDLETVSAALRQLVQIVNTELGRADVVHSSMALQSLALAFENTRFNYLDTKERRILAERIKALLISGNPKIIAGQEWPEILRQSSEALVAVLRFKFGFLKSESFKFDGLNSRVLSLEDADVLSKTLTDVVQALRRAVDRHQGRIENSTVAALIEGLENTGLLPDGFHAASINKTLEAIFGKLLSGASLVNAKENAKGLSHLQLSRIEDFVADWHEGQRIAKELFATGAEKESLQRIRLDMAKLAAESGSKIQTRARLQMHELLTTGRPFLRVGKDGALLDIRPESSYVELAASDFDSLNLARVLVSLALGGYAGETSRAGVLPKVTEDEAQEIFVGLKAIGHDLGIVDIRSLTAGFRTFMETNLFLSVSDGDRYISFHETIEWLHLVRAAGKVADRVHADLVGPCATSELDGFGKKKLQIDCFRERAWDSIAQHTQHLQVLKKAISDAREIQNGNVSWLKQWQKSDKGFFRSLTPRSDLKGLMSTLERASRPIGDVSLPIESSEIRVMLPILHYVESLFARFDVNRSGRLEEEEVWGIFPLARPFIQKLAGDDVSETYQRAIFSWLIVNGTPPEKTFTGKAALSKWVATQHLYRIDADVEDVLRVLASFQIAGRAQKNQAAISTVLARGESWEIGVRDGDDAVFASIRDTFQCAQDADRGLKSLLQLRRDDLFASLRVGDDDAEKRAERFVAKAKSMLYSNQELARYCQMF